MPTLRSDGGPYTPARSYRVAPPPSALQHCAAPEHRDPTRSGAIDEYDWVPIPYWLDGGGDVTETTYTAFADTRMEPPPGSSSAAPPPSSQLAMDVVLSYHAVLVCRTAANIVGRPTSHARSRSSCGSTSASGRPAPVTPPLVCHTSIAANSGPPAVRLSLTQHHARGQLHTSAAANHHAVRRDPSSARHHKRLPRASGLRSRNPPWPLPSPSGVTYDKSQSPISESERHPRFEPLPQRDANRAPCLDRARRLGRHCPWRAS